MCVCVCVSLRWAVDCGLIRSSPRPKHGQHRSGTAQYCRGPGWIRFPQVRHHNQSGSVRSRLLGSLMLVFLPETPSRCHRSSSGSATWPSRSTAASCSSSQSSKDWTSPAVGYCKKRCPPRRARGDQSCVHSWCLFKKRADLSFIFYDLSDVVKLKQLVSTLVDTGI